jgi:hypothetical protein
MRITITKDHIGKTVYGYPTGNNARRGVDKQELTEFSVVGFGRKYAKVLIGGMSFDVSIDPTSGATQQAISSGYGGNAGYIFFESQSDCDNYIKTRDARNKVVSMINHSTIGALSDELVFEIAKQLGIEV